MNTRWYFVEKGDTRGPIPLAMLREMWLNGVIGPNNLILCEGQNHWQRASQLFEGAGSQSSAEMADNTTADSSDLAALAFMVQEERTKDQRRNHQSKLKRPSPKTSPAASWRTLLWVWLSILGAGGIAAGIWGAVDGDEAEKARIMREDGYDGTDDQLARTADAIKRANEQSRRDAERRRELLGE